MSIGKFQILWNNLADLSGTTVTASSSATNNPIANLQNIWPTYTHRTSSLGSPDFWKWDLGAAANVDYMVLWNHNLTSGATLAFQGHTSDDWGSPGVNVTPTYNAEYLVHKLASTTSKRWWRVTATNAANPDGYVEAGHAFLGSYFEFTRTYNVKQPAYIDPSTVRFSVGGQMVSCRRSAYQTMSYEFNSVTSAELTTLKTICDAVGESKPFFIIEDAAAPLTSTYYVRAVGEWRFPPIIEGYHKFTLTVETMR